jgi:hypothetical protein
VKLGTENRRNKILAAVLGVTAVLVAAYEFMPSSTTAAGTAASASTPVSPISALTHPLSRKASSTGSAKKVHAPLSLDPMLNLKQLEATEQIKYEGSGRNIFVSQAEVEIPKPLGPGHTDAAAKNESVWQPPALSAPPAIPLKFFGFANQPGEPKKVFLSKGDDVFIAGEGEIVDRRYKVVRISQGSVEIQDVVGSGPPQTVPLTQG